MIIILVVVADPREVQSQDCCDSWVVCSTDGVTYEVIEFDRGLAIIEYMRG